MDATESAVQTATGDSGTANDSMMEAEEETSVTDLGANVQPPSTVDMDYTSTQDMEEEEELMVTIHGAPATQAARTHTCAATAIQRGSQSQIQIQADSRPSRHGFNSPAARGIVGRFGDDDGDDMPGCDDDLPGFGRTLPKNAADRLSAFAIDWASLGQSEFDLLGSPVSASRRRPDTHPVINLDTLGRGEIAMPGDADLPMNTIAPKANTKRKKRQSKRNQVTHSHFS
jgi:hypothetical protein